MYANPRRLGIAPVAAARQRNLCAVVIVRSVRLKLAVADSGGATARASLILSHSVSQRMVFLCHAVLCGCLEIIIGFLLVKYR